MYSLATIPTINISNRKLQRVFKLREVIRGFVNSPWHPRRSVHNNTCGHICLFANIFLFYIEYCNKSIRLFFKLSILKWSELLQ